MQRRWSRGGAFSLASASVPACLLAGLLALGCAQAGVVGGGHRDGSSPRDGDPVTPQDLSGLDLTGVDLGNTGGGGDAAMCDPLSQSGCGAGEKCSLSASATTCLSDGDKLSGQLCGAAGADDCIKGNLCVSESATSMVAQCRPFCAKDTDCKQTAQGGVASNLPHCLIPISGTMPAVTVCTVACQPVTAAGASGCATGLSCQVFGSATPPIAQFSDCALPGPGGDGADCTTAGCQAGFACVSETPTGGGAAQNHCRKLCRAGTSGDCTGLGGYGCATPTGTGPFPWGFCEPGA